MVLAFLTAWRSLYLRIEAAGKDPALAERICFWAAISGILGARVFYIASFPQELLADPLGAIFGGAGLCFLRRSDWWVYRRVNFAQASWLQLV